MVLRFLKSSFQKVKSALSKTRAILTDKIFALFSGKIDPEKIEQLEQILYEADLGVHASEYLTEKVQAKYKRNPQMEAADLVSFLKEEMSALLAKTPPTPLDISHSPTVVLIVGVNGNGKTTSIAKIAKKYKEEGKKVLLCAADTFRAAAIEQLETWAQNVGVEIVKGAPKSDPAAVAYDGLMAAKARGADIILVDTAGRLQTKKNLMQELEKIRRTCNKVIEGAPHHTLLVLDATTGQNALDQAQIFHQYTPLTGLIITKLDGSAKGGILFRIQEKMGIPIHYIGVGEGEDDLIPFNASNFIEALFE